MWTSQDIVHIITAKGTGTRDLYEHSYHSSLIELSSCWVSSKWHLVMSRPFKNPPEQYRITQTILDLSWTVQEHQILLNHPDLTLPMERQGVPPTNGRLGGTTCPIQQHTSTQRLPWSPSCSLTPTTSILDLLWATPTRHLQGWPASTYLRPNDLDTFRHAQGRPDSSNCIQTPQVRPDHLRSLQITTDHCRSTTAVQEPLKWLNA